MNDKSMLIVDDEENIRKMLQYAFNRAGYNVTIAKDAEEALEILKEQNIQLMFLDLNLPGMSGVDLCRDIRKNKPMAIIYALTGYSSLFELADCREAGFDDYFTKPVDLEILYRAVDEAFKKLERWRKK